MHTGDEEPVLDLVWLLESAKDESCLLGSSSARERMGSPHPRVSPGLGEPFELGERLGDPSLLLQRESQVDTGKEARGGDGQHLLQLVNRLVVSACIEEESSMVGADGE